MRKTKTGSETSIVGGYLYFEDVRQARVGSEEFFAMLDDKHLTTIRMISLSTDWTVSAYITSDVTVKESVDFELTLRKEIKRGKPYWYAYRRVLGVLHKRYIGASEKMDEWTLAKLANKMPSR